MNIIKKDLFDNPLFLKKILIIIIGLLTHNKFYRKKKININGTENIPKNKKKMFYLFQIIKHIFWTQLV